MCVAGIFIPIMRYMDMQRFNYIGSIDSGFFTCSILIGIIAAVFCSLFIGTEFSDGTIRNKVIIGRTRISIYWSNFITCSVVSIAMCVLYFIAYLCVGIPLLGFFKMDIKAVLFLVLVVFMLAIVFSSIFTMIAMLNGNRTITAIISILSVFLLLLVGTYINARLDEPKMLPAYTSINGSPMYEEDTPNPKYLDKKTREVVQFFYDLLPSGQAIQCTSGEAVNLELLPIYSLVIIILTTGAGTFFFKKKELK